MPTFEDNEFGLVTLRRVANASSVRLSLAPNGTVRVSAPKMMPLFMVKRIVKSSKTQIHELMSRQPRLDIKDGLEIGKRHVIEVRDSSSTSVTRNGYRIIVRLAKGSTLDDATVYESVKTEVIKALRKEAKEYLSGRIKQLANQYQFSYSALRYSHASGRWGSCNSKKSISLNIALMRLPYELIDYVLIHELAHTKHLNHSSSFWNEVGRCDKNYHAHRTTLKRYSPSI